MPFEQLLFDFATPLQRERPRPRGVRSRPRRPAGAPAPQPSRPIAQSAPRTTLDGKKIMPKPPRGIDHDRPVQRRYDAIVDEYLGCYKLRVRCWRRSLSGLATLRIFRDGTQDRTIESPYPTSPLRLAIFLHEVGHHAIGLGVIRPRCLEEYHAWRYAIDRMQELGVPTGGTVERRFERAMRYEVSKSTRRGLKRLPHELQRFAV